MSQRNYGTADHSVVSGIQWRQLFRDGMFQNEKVAGEVQGDLAELQTMEEKLQRGKTTIDENPDLSDQGRRRQIRQLVEKEIKPKLERAEKRLEGLTRGMKSILADASEYDIPKANSSDTRAAVREQEIRQHFKNAEQGAILRALRDAEDAGDFETLRALELAPASIAVGPQDAIQKNRIARFERKFPEKMRKYQDWESAKEVYNSILESLKNRIEAIQTL